MFFHHKKLMYTVRVRESNPQLASLMLEQFGGPQGELAAAMRYFTQGLGECDPGRKDLLMDIATEEISHLEIIGTIIAMLNRGPKAIQSEGLAEAEDMRLLGQNSTSHTEQILYGGGPALVNSSGVPWTAAYIDSIGEPAADLRSNIAAEARAKLVYERLINVTDDPGIKDALRFLMTREIAHMKSFEKALRTKPVQSEMAIFPSASSSTRTLRIRQCGNCRRPTLPRFSSTIPLWLRAARMRVYAALIPASGPSRYCRKREPSKSNVPVTSTDSLNCTASATSRCSRSSVRLGDASLT